MRGLVLRQVEYKESSRMLTVLTDKQGKISVSAKGAVRKGSRIAAASRLFAFSEMTLTESRDRWYLTQANTLELFDGLSRDITDLALGSYFLELLDSACAERVEEPEILKLGLRALWLLSEGEKDRRLIKSTFELRLMCLLGYMPELGACAGCGEYMPDLPVIDLRRGELYCASCAEKSAMRPKALCPASLAAMRHVTGAEGGKEFSYTLKEGALARMGAAAESYAVEQLEKSFATLDYYKRILQ